MPEPPTDFFQEMSAPTLCSRWPEAVGLVLRGRTTRVVVPVAPVAGTVISVVNQVEVIIGGHANGSHLAADRRHLCGALQRGQRGQRGELVGCRRIHQR
ncbi:hypothetical protein [Actinophytocola algeriensis]|uniref:Uncharacterized protein n=1 Tax=Actinophytocola algeriensis TaxID=1768010 RepID=A0A7W7PZP6_9PSEU|nr:hypothetical protein [Actinophytocola algeriensis]MBB4904284.1 hypothetical protein [Actinophytocola algeriensis]MBE1476858.1 hypothetical protein [Actinophytocola algeriensis]